MGRLKSVEELESDSLHILREVGAVFRNPVLLYSIGKDSSVLLRLAQKAFYPHPIPWPLLHVDTGFKFPEMIKFRDYYTKKIGARLIVRKNDEPHAKQFSGRQAHTDAYIYYKKTKPLLGAIREFSFDSIVGGSRREEEKSRAKERIFSVRSRTGAWDPTNQRPEIESLYNPMLKEGETMRIFPLANWTEADIWSYIEREHIEVVPLYFAKKRLVVRRNGILTRVDGFTKLEPGEEGLTISCRYRTLGCAPSTGAVPSTAKTVREVLREVASSNQSERVTRAIDSTSDGAMELKKREGYF